MPVRNYDNINVGQLQFHLVRRPNKHQGWACMIKDGDDGDVYVTTPVLFLPTEIKWSVTAVEPIKPDEDPNTPFRKLIDEIIELCRHSFETKRAEKQAKGESMWGVEQDEQWPIVTASTDHFNEGVLTQNKYNFKVHEDEAKRPLFECVDEFNKSVPFNPVPNETCGRLILHVHSWYYDAKRGKMTVRIYMRAVQLVDKNKHGDIRNYLETPKSFFG